MILLSSEPARPARVRDWPHAWLLAVGTVCFGAFMGQLDASIVTLTYRPVEHQFHASLASVEWVSLSYLLSLTALLVPVGRWSDRRGRKLSYLHGLAVFSASSAVCGLASSLTVLIVARTVQGFGAAMLQANSVALVTHSAPRGRVRTALGIQAAAQAVGLAIGPTMGGIIVYTIGWRWVYAINVPVGIVAMIAAVYLLPRTHQRRDRGPMDGSGSAMLALSAAALLLAVSTVSGWRTPGWVTAVLFVAAAASAWRLVVQQGKTTVPLIDAALLRNWDLSGGLLGALSGYLALFGPLVIVPVVLEAHGMTAVHAGIVLTSLPAGFACAATIGSAALPRTWTDRSRCLLGSLVTSAAFAAGVTLEPSTTSLVAVLAAAGIGLGIFTPANNTQIMSAVPESSSATGGAMVNMARGLGTALGISVVTLCLDLVPNTTTESRVAFLALLVASLGAVASSRHPGLVSPGSSGKSDWS